MVHGTAAQRYTRTQVMLTPRLIAAIDRVRKTTGESRSEYLRRAAEARMRSLERAGDRRRSLAQRIVGSMNTAKHPRWHSIRATEVWRSNIRDKWGRAKVPMRDISIRTIKLD